MLKKKEKKAEQRMRWQKLKKEFCCFQKGKVLRQTPVQEVLPDDWRTTGNATVEQDWRILGMSS